MFTLWQISQWKGTSFNARSPEEKEGIDQYVPELRQLATRYYFEHIIPEEILRDRVILGITDLKLRARLLRDANIIS